MATPKELGKVFRDAREKVNISLEEASSRSRIHPSVVEDIENGVFDRLGRPYVKSFLRKYAAFLGLDEEEMINMYREVSEKQPGREFRLSSDAPGNSDETIMAMNSRKIQAVLVAALAMVLIALVFVFAGMLRSRVYSRGPVPAEKSARQEKVIKVKTVQKTAPAPRAPWRAANEGLKVTLNAKGAVWVMVKSGEKTVYVATMSKGESKTIETDGDLKLWTGKAENLELVVNGRDIGNVARGVVKNIRISSDSVMIGDSLVTRLQ